MPGIDPHPLGLVRSRLAGRGVTDVRPLAGGASSLTYVGTVGEKMVVVKMAPPGLPPTRHRDVLRQARIIRALGGTSVPVPEVLWQDAGDPPLFVMTFLDGDAVEPLFDAGPANATMAQRMRNAARVMAELHGVDVAAAGLGDEPVVGLGAEVDRWCRALETVDSGMAPGWPRVADELRATTPTALPTSLVHGDFRLGNLLADGARIIAVVDWEIWSAGDPRVDVGWFLVNADPDTYRRVTPHLGSTPSPAELADVYAEALGAEVADLDWFQALACFKSAATWSLIVKNNRRRVDPYPELEAMAPALPRLIDRAAHFLSAAV